MYETGFELNRNKSAAFYSYHFAESKNKDGKSVGREYGNGQPNGGAGDFWQNLDRAATGKKDFAEEVNQKEKREESWEEKLQRFDEEMERIKEENKRERERLEEERFRKKRIQRKLMEKLAYKKYLARQDEIRQMNEKIALERALGEDVYIEKAPLSKTLSVAEIMAICSEV